MYVVLFLVTFLAAVRCVVAATSACCPAIAAYQPDLVLPQAGKVQCQADRAGLGQFPTSPNGEWRFQRGWTVSDAARFIVDFVNEPSYWRYTDLSRVPVSSQTLTFYTAQNSSTVFPPSRPPEGVWVTDCDKKLYSLVDVAGFINSQIGAIVIIADPSVNDDWQNWLTGTWATINKRNGPLIVVPRTDAAYEEDLLTGLKLLDSSKYSDCVYCPTPTTTTILPTATTTITKITTITTLTTTASGGAVPSTAIVDTTAMVDGTAVVDPTAMVDGTAVVDTTAMVDPTAMVDRTVVVDGAAFSSASALGYGVASTASIGIVFGLHLTYF